ncbi:MAG: Ig-like domain-containing protein [Kiritimatiellae bacterium]|nr:Ig-like domain-containing protein [Kiritimatiellia bacterium]
MTADWFFSRSLLARALLAAALSGVFPAWALDYNGDGAIRVALLSRAVRPGEIEASKICADLEKVIKAARSGVPVKVTHEPLGESRSLLGWWHYPDGRADRERLLAGSYDCILLAEADDIAGEYPELFFEGVRCVSQAFKAVNTRVALLLTSRPGNTFRDTRFLRIANTFYRVGDGCGLEVIPAAFAWNETLARNRMEGNSPMRARANAFLAAATAFCQLTGSRFPKGALHADWTVKKTTEVLALSAREAVEKARVRKHYAGDFSGVVRVQPRVRKQLMVYVPNAAEDDVLGQNLRFILDAAWQECFWKTPKDWYSEGFDRHSLAFDLVYGDMQQISMCLDDKLFTSRDGRPAAMPAPLVAVFRRNPADAKEGLNTLRMLETLLIEGYDYAKKNDLVFIPYQIAWARARQANPKLTETIEAGKENDWLNFMLANMIYTAVTGRYQMPTEKPKPQHVNAEHPRGYHDLCARIGYETVMQLSSLREPLNAVLLRSENYHVDEHTPGFVGVRLLDKPSQDVRVLCAASVPGIVELSQETLVFRPDDFDIEQSVRITPATNTPAVFFNFMVNAQSNDNGVDGRNDQKPFLLNYDPAAEGTLDLVPDTVSAAGGFAAVLKPTVRPCEIVRVSVLHQGLVTEELYFSPHAYDGATVRLRPTAEDYAKNTLDVKLIVQSEDRRYGGRQFDFALPLARGARTVPVVRITSPADGSALDGPAFVTATAEVVGATEISALEIYLGHKRLGRATALKLEVAVEQGPPQSRLPEGPYTVWAEATTADGLVVMSAPATFSVRERRRTAVQ